MDQPSPLRRAKRPKSGQHLTDLGNAKRLVERHGEDLLHVRGRGWFVWDGQRWRQDRDGEVMRRAKDTAEHLLLQAAACRNLDLRPKLAGHAIKSESLGRLKAMVELAETEREIARLDEDLDAHPSLLNVLNGTLDLNTLELRPHDRADLLTKLAPVEYDPDARHPDWDALIEHLSDGDLEMAAFLARAVGYSLTGDPSEEKLFFPQGPAATGKSTFLDAIQDMLGEYAVTADFETFLRRGSDGGPRPDVARFAGCRFVSASEVDEGKRLAEGLVKQLTGGDVVAARFLYKDLFEFRPQFTLWLGANHRPHVAAADTGMWRRIVLIPFTNVVPASQRDLGLKARLRTPEGRAAILAWAVEGHRQWQQIGLRVPQSITDYTTGYREENDYLRLWVEEACLVDQRAWTATADLRLSYTSWAEEAGQRPVSPNALAEGLKDRGCVPEKRGQQRGWGGIGLHGAER